MYICHPDFSGLTPINVFHKEYAQVEEVQHPEELQNKHILFRKKFTLEPCEKVTMNITADDYFKLYINGKFVTQGPAAGYIQAYNFMELDITDYLVAGENTIAVHTYYQGLINRVWVSGDLREMLYAEVFADGEKILETDTSWKCTYHTGYTACCKTGLETAFMECYDSGAPEVGFAAPDFDDSGWGFAVVQTNADYTLNKQGIKLLDIYDVAPASIEKVGDTLRIDMGFEAVGYVCAEAKGKKGDTIIIRCGEELNPDGSVRYDMRCWCLYEEKWILSGRNDTLEQYDYKAFRYINLVVPEGVEISNIRMKVRHYPFEKKAVYNTDNEKLLKILKLCEDTAKYGTQENYMDCPTREKGQYLNDMTISARAQATLTGDTTMYKKAIMDNCVGSFICPGMMCVTNCSMMQEIADASLQMPAQVCWIYSMDGDIEFLKSIEPYMTGLYHYFRDTYMNEDGLLESVKDKWNLVDWPGNLRDNYDFDLTRPVGADGAHNVMNAHWYGFLCAMDEYYTIIGKPVTGMREKVKAAFIKAFYSEELGLFVDAIGSKHAAIHSNILPLLFDIGTEDEALKQRLIEYIHQRGLTNTGVSIAYFALAALKKHGREDIALELTLDKGLWLLMLSEGATTTFEAWGKDQKKNTSLFHPWATAPAIIFAEGVRYY